MSCMLELKEHVTARALRYFEKDTVGHQFRSGFVIDAIGVCLSGMRRTSRISVIYKVARASLFGIEIQPANNGGWNDPRNFSIAHTKVCILDQHD